MKPAFGTNGQKKYWELFVRLAGGEEIPMGRRVWAPSKAQAEARGNDLRNTNPHLYPSGQIKAYEVSKRST